ncbi:hypothetical protein R3W88_011991 [Solanum pinnatisectum]|uniref:RNase H type-1 domain-containing protein n=1 Tax=Solanum pinnatisectum TaxID=50273 RepID=A0AAV9L878_9SOLN|nr:hypothetical protein R3W88_011991 [Solanum pinnatisectum]
MKIIDSTTLVAEVKAISEGLQYCLENHYSNIIIETDSLKMVNIIDGVWKIPWSVSIEVGSIHRIRDLISVRVQHFLREGNTLADFFANLIFNFAGTYEFKSNQDVPSEGRKIIMMDKGNTPYIRTKQINSSTQ